MRGDPPHPPPTAAPQAYVLQLGLGAVPASLEDVRHELGNRLDDLQPRLSWERDDLRLVLVVPASDLWVAVLTGMALVTDAGYPVETLRVGRQRGAPGTA